jgi:hypothetical protein
LTSGSADEIQGAMSHAAGSSVLVVIEIGGVVAVGVFAWLYTRRTSKQAAELVKNFGAEADAYTDKVLGDIEDTERKEAHAKDDFRRRAKVMPAVILSTRTVGQVNLKPMLKVSVRVDDPAGPYTAEGKAVVEQTHIIRYADGAAINVLVDPENRQHIEFDEP